VRDGLDAFATDAHRVRLGARIREAFGRPQARAEERDVARRKVARSIHRESHGRVSRLDVDGPAAHRRACRRADAARTKRIGRPDGARRRHRERGSCGAERNPQEDFPSPVEEPRRDEDDRGDKPEDGRGDLRVADGRTCQLGDGELRDEGHGCSHIAIAVPREHDEIIVESVRRPAIRRKRRRTTRRLTCPSL